ncbi:MAG: MerR family transcriptional regulator [Desulfobacteraceae bacterium]|nr:MerR family transcriptional regulator [Desulfobacteraceae bacterium]
MVGKKKSEVQPLRADLPIYPIGVAAKLLDVHPRTLRIYETEGLVRPNHQGARRLYSPNDIKWIFCLRSMIHDQGISIPGIKRLLGFAPCWEIAGCPPEVHETCEAAVDWAAPRHLRNAGEEIAEKKRQPAACGKKGCGQKKNAARN